jgi:hypothetical protein
MDLSGRKWQEAGEDCIIRTFVTSIIHQMWLRLSTMGNEMGKTWSTSGKGEKCVENFICET